MSQGWSKTKELLAIALPYGVLLASIYLLAYWGSWGVNPFQYASAMDIVTAGIAGIGIALILMPVAGGVGAVIGASLASAHDKIAGLDGGTNSAGGIPVPTRSYIASKISLLALLGVPLVLLFVDTALKYAVLGGLANILASRAIDSQRSSDFLGCSPLTLKVGVFFVVLVPFLAFYKGAADAEQVMDLNSGRFVDVSRSGLPVEAKQPIFYLGMLGSSHLLYEWRSESVIVIPVAEQGLVITRGGRGR